GLVEARTLEQVADANAVVVAWQGNGAAANEGLLRTILETLPRDTPCFVHRVLANSRATAEELLRLADSRGIALCAGTSMTVTFRLPDVELEPGARIKEALIVVQGPFPEAELDALNGLLPIVERRRRGESGVATVRLLEGPEIWRAGDRNEWSWPLL